MRAQTCARARARHRHWAASFTVRQRHACRAMPGFMSMNAACCTSSARRRLRAVRCMLHVVCHVPSVAPERARASLLIAGMVSASVAGARAPTPGSARSGACVLPASNSQQGGAFCFTNLLPTANEHTVPVSTRFGRGRGGRSGAARAYCAQEPDDVCGHRLALRGDALALPLHFAMDGRLQPQPKPQALNRTYIRAAPVAICGCL